MGMRVGSAVGVGTSVGFISVGTMEGVRVEGMVGGIVG